MQLKEMFFIVFFPETRHWTVLEAASLGANAENCKPGTKINLLYPVRRQPFEAVVKGVSEIRDEAEKLLEELAGSCTDELPPQQSERPNFVTADMFSTYMSQVVQCLKEISNSSNQNFDACVKEMSKIKEAVIRDKDGVENYAVDSPDMAITNMMSTNKGQQGQKSNPSSSAPSMQMPRSGWASTSNIVQPAPPPEEEIGRPTWEFASKEKIDEVFEDSDNYKIFARKISYAIFDENEQKLKINERNKKKVSELRKIIKLKYGSDRREFDDMIWRTCKNAVNNTTYNEAKRRKRHPELATTTGNGDNCAFQRLGGVMPDNGNNIPTSSGGDGSVSGPAAKRMLYTDESAPITVSTDATVVAVTSRLKTEPISEVSYEYQDF
uniref:BEN domain-containing protein n=1 Tax=Panagrellus redivivus TaxID=6233 RepID=A0A7E4ZZB4_PANRE